jgi:post-segregation antitoxin (ccd killing protein)
VGRYHLFLDDDLVQKARDLGLNLSKITENCLRRVIEALEAIQSQNSHSVRSGPGGIRTHDLRLRRY